MEGLPQTSPHPRRGLYLRALKRAQLLLRGQTIQGDATPQVAPTP
jgi:hypothetical protein